MRLLLCLYLLVSALAARAADPLEYCPLAEGMAWTMDAKVTTPDGKVIEATAHRAIDAAEEREGKTYYRMRTWMEGIPQLRPFETLERRTDQGLFSIDFRDLLHREFTSMVLPFVVGNKWSHPTDTTTIHLEVVALEDLILNGKTYEKCFRIKAAAEDGSYREELWQAPGLGSIKSDVTLTGGVKISVTLREFTPGKK